MTRSQHRPATRYAFAALAVGLLAWFEVATWPLFRSSSYLPLAIGVVLAATLGGPKPGLFATVLALVATRILPDDVRMSARGDAMALLALTGIGIAASVLSVDRHSSRARLRRVLEGVSDSCGFLGPDWTFIYVNRAAAERTGKRPEALNGAGISEIFPHLAELPALREVRRAMDDCIPGRFETFHTGHWYETNLYPSGDGVTIMVRDVTDRRQAEEALRESERRLRAIFDQAIAGIAQIDADGRFLAVNERYAEIVGRSSSELLNLRVSDITHPEDAPRNAALFQGLMTGGGAFVVEERYVRPNGSLVWVRKQVSALRDPAGHAPLAFAIVEEVTERKRAEADADEALRRERGARSEAEAANRSKDEFLAVVSHELRTPLTAILGWLRLMRLGAVDAAGTTRAFDTIEKNADSLVRIVEDLLDVSRIISGKLELDVRQVKVAPIVRAALEVVRPAAEAKKIDIAVRLRSEAITVNGDPSRLQQVIWNLLANAVKFTPSGGEIAVTVERRDGHVAISVRDTGAGIAPEFLPRVFERFRQADSSHARQHSGLGLGLAIVRHLVEMHGGTVQAESAGVGRGSLFTVLLPVHASLPAPVVPPLDATRRGVAVATLSHSLPELENTRVLLVEDDPDTRTIVARILTWRGAEVRACGSAAEARELFGRWKPDVLVSDIGMPGESGYSLIESLRRQENGRRLPAIALTAYAQEAHRARAVASGYDAHVAKPVEPVVLVQAVASVRAGKPAPAAAGHP